MRPVGKGFMNQFLRKALKKQNSKRRDSEKEESKNMGHQKGREYVFDLHGATLVFLWVHNNSVHLLDTFAHLINKMYV